MSAVRAFSAPTRIVAGLGAVERLGPELEALGARRIAVACDEGVANAGLLERVLAGIPPGAVVVLPLVHPDPLVAHVEAAAEAARAEECDAVMDQVLWANPQKAAAANNHPPCRVRAKLAVE